MKWVFKKVSLYIKNSSYKKKLVLTCLTVSILPLLITSIVTFHQMKKSLIEKELDSLSSSLTTITNTLDFQISFYENLLYHIANSDVVITTATKEYLSVSEKYEQLKYSYDVFLNNIYNQYPDIEQISLYTEREDLSHGKQLKPLSKLYSFDWFPETLENITATPTWYIEDNHYIVLIAKIPNPYIQYIKSYSNNCICIRISAIKFFKNINNQFDDYHIKVSSLTDTFFEYTSPSILHLQQKKQVSLFSNTSNDWSILLEKPYFLITLPASNILLAMLGVTIFCLLLSWVLSNCLSNFSVKRIDYLHQKIQQLKAGNFHIEICDTCEDEIGELTNSFQSMANEINHLIEENYKKEIGLKEAQFKALQAQINPHFLYNCLSLINSKALLIHQEDISKMSQLMSTFYRTTLNKGNSMTLLKDEIKNVISYIDIQKLLHNHSFEVSYQIDEPLPDVSVPNLILQPLVENAIIHGILPKREGLGRLFLIVRSVEQNVHITIMDNGLGIPEEKIPLLTQLDSSGYGIKNVNERLIFTFGKESHLHIQSIPNKSTIVRFVIPIL